MHTHTHTHLQVVIGGLKIAILFATETPWAHHSLHAFLLSFSYADSTQSKCYTAVGPNPRPKCHYLPKR